MATTLPTPIPARRPAVRYVIGRATIAVPLHRRSDVHVTPRRRRAAARARFVAVWSARFNRNAGAITVAASAAGLGVLSGAALQILGAL